LEQNLLLVDNPTKEQNIETQTHYAATFKTLRRNFLKVGYYYWWLIDSTDALKAIIVLVKHHNQKIDMMFAIIFSLWI